MTALLDVRELSKAFGPHAVLRGLNLEVHPGELAAVLGPSGCGKTTLLRVIAGFDRADGGTIRLAGRLLDGGDRTVPAERRGITVVPQDGALFPHLTVGQNVAFGLSGRRADHAGRVAEVLALVGLTGLAERYPHQLSGGQQQRTAVARALAPAPALVLLDEPFSALDAGLRAQLRNDIREVLQADGATAVLVTHDQDEALSLADRVAVMSDGVVQMQGRPAEVYLRPTSLTVARFVGDVTEVAGYAGAGQVDTPLGRLPIRPDQAAVTGSGIAVLRPEQVLIDPTGEGADIVSVRYFGRDTEVSLRVHAPSGPLALRARTNATVPSTGRVGVRIRGVVSFFADPGQRAAEAAPMSLTRPGTVPVSPAPAT